MLHLVAPAGERAYVPVRPAPRAIVSWSTLAPVAAIELIVHTVDGRRSRALPYVRFAPETRTSLDGADGIARIATDVVSASSAIAGIDVCADVALTSVAVSVPVHAPAQTAAPWCGELDVPPRSQYVAAFPDERGWCTPAAIAMLTATHGVDRAVAAVADAITDQRYGGSGNWAFAVAYAAACGLIGAVAYLRDLTAVDALLAAGLPPALSIAWDGDLPGAPLPRSAGHLVVVRGRTADGSVIVNDPAYPHVRQVYPAAAFARAWLGHGGVALLVAPPARSGDLVRCANA